MAGICGTDIHLWLGQLPIPLPVILGHESAGRIEELGPGLEKDWRGNSLAVGDRITWASSITCGECFYCRMKRQPTRCVARKAYGISYCADDSPHLRGGYPEGFLPRGGAPTVRTLVWPPPAGVSGGGWALVAAIRGPGRARVEWGDFVVTQGGGRVGWAARGVPRRSGAGRVVVIGGPS